MIRIGLSPKKDVPGWKLDECMGGSFKDCLKQSKTYVIFFLLLALKNTFNISFNSTNIAKNILQFYMQDNNANQLSVSPCKEDVKLGLIS